MIVFAAAVLLLGLAVGDAEDVQYEECCKDTRGKAANCTAKDISLQMENCSANGVCILNHNMPIMINFTFTAVKGSREVFLDAGTDWLGGKMPIPGLNYQLCHETLPCPIKKNQEYEGTLKVAAPQVPPSGPTVLHLKLTGNKPELLCAKIKVTIV